MIVGCTASPSPVTVTVTPKTTGATTTSPSTSTPTTQIVEKDKTYNVVNPAGEFVPVKTIALNPRLDTLKGKTIWVWQGESDPVIGPALYPLMQKTYPDSTIKYTGVSGMGLSSIEDEVKKNANAVIRLNGW